MAAGGGGGAAGAGGAGGVGGAGGTGAAAGVAAMAGVGSVSSMRAPQAVQATKAVTAPAESAKVHISSAARAALAADSAHGHAHRSSSVTGPFGKLEKALAADALLAMLDPNKKHHHHGIVGALMAAEAVKMYQSVQAMSGPHPMGAATGAVTAPAAAHA